MAGHDEDGDFPLVVRRPVYEAAVKLEAAAKAAGHAEAFSDAEEKAGACRAAGDEQGAAFWHAVFTYLMDGESANEGVEHIILEEGDSYDRDEGKVIRAGTGQPRSDTGNR
jgi:hypothetical protein